MIMYHLTCFQKHISVDCLGGKSLSKVCQIILLYFAVGWNAIQWVWRHWLDLNRYDASVHFRMNPDAAIHSDIINADTWQASTYGSHAWPNQNLLTMSHRWGVGGGVLGILCGSFWSPHFALVIALSPLWPFFFSVIRLWKCYWMMYQCISSKYWNNKGSQWNMCSITFLV